MILNKIIEYKQSEVEDMKSRLGNNSFVQGFSAPSRKGFFKKALQGPGINLIAEVKKASPSKGIFIENFNPKRLAEEYEQAGAAAVSVLTDNHFFRGSIEDLILVKNTLSIPVLRKDFIIDPCQIYQARHIGADAILLIASILEEKTLKSFIELTEELELDALVEVHSREELKMALNCGGEIIGINNRDLQNFKTDITTTLKLAPLVPEDCVLVSESGIHSAADIKILDQARVSAVLLGEALITAPNVTTKIQELFGDD